MSQLFTNVEENQKRAIESFRKIVGYNKEHKCEKCRYLTEIKGICKCSKMGDLNRAPKINKEDDACIVYIEKRENNQICNV